MLKLVAIALGLLTAVTIAPSAGSTSYQTNRTPQGMSGNLYAERLVPIKKSVKLGPTIIKATSKKVRTDRKVGLSAETKERQRIQTACQRDADGRRSNERAVGMFENSKTENGSNPNANGFASADSLNNSVNQGSCGFSIQIPY